MSSAFVLTEMLYTKELHSLSYVTLPVTFKISAIITDRNAPVRKLKLNAEHQKN